MDPRFYSEGDEFVRGANQQINIRRSIKQGAGSVSELAELDVISSGPG